MIFDPSGRPINGLNGGVPLQRVPVIPWDSYVRCGLKVHKDGKIQECLFDPQPMADADEAFQTMRLLLATAHPKPGPISWETVPEVVQRHFRFQQATPPG